MQRLCKQRGLRKVLALAGTLAFLSIGSTAFAGKQDLDTGAGCVGTGCIDWDGTSSNTQTSNGTSAGSSTLPGGVSAEDCSATNTRRIGDAVRWLRGNLAAVTAELNRAEHLMSWPGNSRENFEEKLDGELNFYCIDHKNKCDDGNLRGIVYPVVAAKRINLCAANMVSHATSDATSTIDSRFVGTIAHEIGHLVRANAHRDACSDRYYRPRFSQAVGLAAEHAFLGVAYESTSYALRCPGATTSGTTTDSIHGPNFNKPDLTAVEPPAKKK